MDCNLGPRRVEARMKVMARKEKKTRRSIRRRGRSARVSRGGKPALFWGCMVGGGRGERKVR